MAAVSLSPLPIDLSSMSTSSARRVPLSNNTTAVNSPYRGAATKQKRPHASFQRDEVYGHNQPAAKRQMLDAHQGLRTPPRQLSTQLLPETRLLTRKPQNSAHSSFERASATTRERQQQTVVKVETTLEGGLERLRWQKHHRKLFPSFVFYFESVPEDIRIKYARQVNSLGAREDKFFSKAVTHVVTTRTIPTEQHTTSTDASTKSLSHHSQSHHSQPQTINPLLLDRSSESAVPQSDLISKAKFTFETPNGRRPLTSNHDVDLKRGSGRSAGGDVLHRAREMRMKIWALEKLQRMMEAMFDVDPNVHAHNTRSNTVQGSVSARGRGADLSQLLREERINGPSDRDPTVATKEMIIFKGPFLYVHDIDERQRPMMVREYPKVANKEEGDWPQFRSVSGGKCPFVEEGDTTRANREKEMLRLQRQQEKEKALATRSRTTSVESNRMQPPKAAYGKRMADMDDGSSRVATVSTQQGNPFSQSRQTILPKIEPEPSSQRSQNAFVSRAGTVRKGLLYAGEPVASGVQPSAVTSAIRSNMISSTASQPGLKAGTSKEVHGLQRKVLEKNSGGPGSYGLTSSRCMTDIAAAAREDTILARASRKRSQEKLAQIEEDAMVSEAEENARRHEAVRKARAMQQRKRDERDPKPGYCENCQEKFEDFDEHVLSRKHRKFAEKLENWKELDELLAQLTRPLHSHYGMIEIE